MTKAIDPKSVERGTGITWNNWLKFFKKIKAQNLSHKEIAKAVYEQNDVSGWWAQNVTVAYEQHIGRRLPGQVNSKEFAVSISKTLSGSMDEVFDNWLKFSANYQAFNGISLKTEGKITQSDKWRYWRTDLSDGSRIIVTVSENDNDRSILVVTLEKLTSKEQVEQWRKYWKDELKQL